MSEYKYVCMDKCKYVFIEFFLFNLELTAIGSQLGKIMKEDNLCSSSSCKS